MNSLRLSDIKLTELQKLFRDGKIKEKDIPKQQLEKLKNLYHKQINLLENSIEADRQKILKIKNQL